MTGLMNSAGSLVNTYNYKAYGESLSTTGNLENRYRYTGREYVEAGSNGTELYYYRARYYRPDLGRFISKDPLGMIDGANMFIYVKNNPVSLADPTGQFLKCQCLGSPDNLHDMSNMYKKWDFEKESHWYWFEFKCPEKTSETPCLNIAQPCLCIYKCIFFEVHEHHHQPIRDEFGNVVEGSTGGKGERSLPSPGICGCE